MENIIQVHNLVKEYKKKNGDPFIAVNGISFDVRRGEIFSFLGPNGAGKSTTISMLTTQKEITSGSVTIDGKDLEKYAIEAREKIGIVAQHNNLDRGLTARENLIFHALYFGMSKHEANKRADFLLDKFGLTDWENEYVRSFSGGMAQRLKIARAMVHRPEILFLDEPTTGLDPAYREILWEQMLELNKEGTTVFLTTHYMEEPERFSDIIAIFSHGKIQAIGTSDELKKRVPGKHVANVKFETISSEQEHLLQNLNIVESLSKTENDQFTLYLKDGDNPTESLLSWIRETNLKIETFNLSGISLDDVFVYLTTEGATQ
ncbi:ATP-binding cassette domain-containing protein [Erysipelothrix inopinata]|uniref:ATP-binding cassette domain-containing protein n=1 Tax=Erysipelothrix inopinata TaxID=225084 RepID=A0A7G9S1D4_9FIRM|nr:ATP-binding cassette domain-containing protein [Erysipelothrix inopinata]QNN61659.1 ATP-binding cassette domain-containing protein [Erysipelothrix inopinata]